MKHVKVSPAAAAVPQPCNPTLTAQVDAMRKSAASEFKHDPTTCWWCIKNSARHAGLVICPHGKVEIYCEVCDQDARDELKRNPPGDNAIYVPDGYFNGSKS